MAQYATENIRTVALVGHGAAGKTTLAEALLACAKAIPTPGSVERGTTVSDFDPLEKSLQLFEEGMKLSNACRKELEEAEGKVEILLTQNGRLQAEPYAAEAKK